jgi:hypothetical protein
MNMDLITTDFAWGQDDLTAYDQDDKDAIRELLLGHKVEKVADDHLLLDNGTLVRVVPNDGGCACTAGDYWLTELNGVDNIITRVEFEEGTPKEQDEWGYPETSYRIFVIAEDKRFNLLTIDGDDGNGYYGTGYELLVRVVEGET